MCVCVCVGGFGLCVCVCLFFLWHKNMLVAQEYILWEHCFVTSEVPMRFPELRIFHFGSSSGSGAPIWEPWGCIFGVLEFQRHCEKHA